MGALFDSELPPPPSPPPRVTPELVREWQRQKREAQSNHRARRRQILAEMVGRPVTDEEVEICAVVGNALVDPPDECFVQFRLAQFKTTRTVDQVAILLAECFQGFLISMDRNEIRIAWDAT